MRHRRLPNITIWGITQVRVVRLSEKDSAMEGPSKLKTTLESVQLRTTKVNKLSIMGTRIFSENLTTDPTPDGQKKNLEGVFIIFPRVFGCAKILSKIFDTYD